MNVLQTTAVEIALRALSEDDRRRVLTWIDNLKKWDTSPSVRAHAHKLASSDGVYVRRTSTDYWIFFKPEKDRIVVLDIATTATLRSFREHSVTGQ
jgi:hypothetical protein